MDVYARQYAYEIFEMQCLSAFRFYFVNPSSVRITTRSSMQQITFWYIYSVRFHIVT